MKRGKCLTCAGAGAVMEESKIYYFGQELKAMTEAALMRALKTGRLKGPQGNQEIRSCCGKVWIQEKTKS